MFHVIVLNGQEKVFEHRWVWFPTDEDINAALKDVMLARHIPMVATSIGLLRDEDVDHAVTADMLNDFEVFRIKTKAGVAHGQERESWVDSTFECGAAA